MTCSTSDGVGEKPNQSRVLPVTGERYLPQDMSGDIELEHLHRYALACEFAHGRSVLDIASGEGYGSHLLAQVAATVIGVDISSDAIAHAKQAYQHANLQFLMGSCAAIPLADHSIDLAVSFETIEHHDRHEEMLAELKRVLKPNGMLIISSPDKLNYSDARGFKNKFHVKELYFDEFRDLLATHFRYQNFHAQRIYYGSLMLPIEGLSNQFHTFAGNTNMITKAKGTVSSHYFIAFASDVELPLAGGSIFDGTSAFTQLIEKTTAKLIETHEQLIQTTQQLNRTVNSIYWRITLPLRLVRKWVKNITGL